MSRHPSILRFMGHQGRNTPGVEPDTVAAMKALADVEAKFGLSRALNGALAAYCTAIAFVGMNGTPDAFDSAIERMQEGIDMLRSAQRAVATGHPDRCDHEGITVAVLDAVEVLTPAGRA